MMSRIFQLALLLFGLGASGCGPTDEEAGRAILFVSPFVFATSMAWLSLLTFLWRKLKPELVINMRPVFICGGILFGLAILSLVGVSKESDTGSFNSTTDGIPGVMEWVGMALVILGTSFMSLHLLTWRIWQAVSPGSAFHWSHVPLLVLLLWPALPMALNVTYDWDELAMPLWIFPGYVGATTIPILLGLLIEVWIRISRHKKRRLTATASDESGAP